MYPSNVSAKLGPVEPTKAAQNIRKEIKEKLGKKHTENFEGVVIIDANDLGRDILGNASELSDETVAQIMRDNPMGQGSEQTPLVVCVY